MILKRRILFIPHVNFNACIQQPSILEVFSEYFDTIVQKEMGGGGPGGVCK